MTVCVNSAALTGIEAALIQVETRVCAGVGYFVVGLAGEAVKESLFRVESAIISAGFEMPRQKILISLAPAGMRKEGAVFDLPIALSVLAASGQLNEGVFKDALLTGELSLTGRLRPVKGALSVAMAARKAGFKRLVVPEENAPEAAMESDVAVYGSQSLSEVVAYLHDKSQIRRTTVESKTLFAQETLYNADFSDVRGQAPVKRALEVMAAGGHNGLLIGPPGSGKTMLATRLPGIMPPLTLNEALETTRIYSVAGQLDDSGLMTRRPFRAPHHTASDIALVGGGPVAMPGEISLAHHGVLFLDELPEFRRHVLEILRQPLEERRVTVSRASYSVNFPANFVLLAAMNPCPCGFYGHPERKCSCTPQAVRSYLHKLSGPFLDRIDLHISVGPADLRDQGTAESSGTIRARVINARDRQLQRSGVCNALMTTGQVRDHCALGKTGQEVLNQAMARHKLSARSYERILKVARTIADMAGRPAIQLEDLAEAITLRRLAVGRPA